jgi:16S rRNA (cytidine1402-2'-O)-methyltransferase
MIKKDGVLFVVATPIGNLQDISQRAIETLKAVDSIAAEDTRHSASLLQQFDIRTPIFSLHEHNEREKAAALIAKLQSGESIALISDAGTPLISDPGFYLVREVRAVGIRVVPIPGACAAIAALSASGLPTDKFIFEGFLPVKSKARLDHLMAMRQEARTLVFYEAPHRILDVLEDMQKVFGDTRQVVIARELTKMYETICSGVLPDLIKWVKEDSNQQRGEIVVLVEGAPEKTLEIPAEKILALLLDNLPLKQAVLIAEEVTGIRKNELYEIALILKNQKS